MLAIFIDVCLPLLLVIGIGWALDRKFDFDLRSLVKLNIYLFVPAFILVRVSTSTISGSTAAMVVGFTLCISLSMGVISWLVSKLRGDDAIERAGLQLGTMFYNSGNWGLPLLTLAFPGEGGVIQLFVLATMNLSGFTAGVYLANATNEKKNTALQNVIAIFKQPSVYAIAAAVALRAMGNPLTEIEFIWLPLNHLSDALIAFALLTLGVQLSKTKPPKPVGRLGWALGIRLLGGPLIAMLLTWVFGIEGILAAILIVGAASPTAVNTALLAYEFGSDSRFAAATVYYSTLCATLVVTLLLTLLNYGFIPWAIPTIP